MSTKMSTKMWIQVYSDIHIELQNTFPRLPVKSRYLMLAGDIGQLKQPRHSAFHQFLKYCSSNWEKVFYIPGNHEFYVHDKTMDDIELEYKRCFEKYKNIFYLNNSFAELNDQVNIYGSVFWTSPSFTSTYEAQMYVNDYNHISYVRKDGNTVVPLDIQKVKELSEESLRRLEEYLTRVNKKTIVVTHFPPHQSGTSHPKYALQGKVMKNYFSHPDDLFRRFPLSNVLCWISGHTHYSYDFISTDGVRCISNQVGYKSESTSDTGFNEDGLYEITL